VQWLEGNFFGNDSYWGNPGRGKIPFDWSCCFDQLAQLCPQAIEYAQATRTTNDWFIEWGGGYYFPDHFGSRRADRWELLARHARRTWELMKKTNERIIGFNFSQLDTLEARNAQNFQRLIAAAKTGKPIRLKRGLSMKIEEWLLAGEYVVSNESPNLMLCERGNRTFET